MEEFEYKVPDYMKKLDQRMILKQLSSTNKTDNKVTDVRISHSNSNLGSFITYKNENKVGYIDRSKIDLLSQYLYALDKLSALQRNLSDKLNAFDDQRDTVVI